MQIIFFIQENSYFCPKFEWQVPKHIDSDHLATEKYVSKFKFSCSESSQIKVYFDFQNFERPANLSQTMKLSFNLLYKLCEVPRLDSEQNI